VRFIACVFIAAFVTGCAGRALPRSATPKSDVTKPAAAAVSTGNGLEDFIEKVRKLAAEARPEPKLVVSVEGTDPRLRGALAAAAAVPSAQTYRAVALEYRRLGIFDRAHQYLQNALLLQPQDAATYDALARMWRDSGFPNLALGDAYRAVYFAPESAAVHNTLGTVLQAIGRRDLARAAYERALNLDPSAAYALNNLCYGWVLDGDAPKAAQACKRALAIDPGLAAANNNLGLARAVGGDLVAAQQAFAANGDRAAQLYNSGIVYLARRQFANAVKAFEAAHSERPTMTTALARARQAAAAAASTTGGE
jgi:tetratricopeptide (TPR) repeat protein